MDLNILYETFELYLNKAKACVTEKNITAAKKYYYLAAEQMLKLAQGSTGELRKVRFARAKSVIDQADALVDPNAKATPAGGQGEKNGAKPQGNADEKKLTLEEALEELNSLVGLGKVKAQVRDWIDQIKVFRMRKERGMKVPPMSYHLVFTGNPGTGKTTVARLMSHIYREIGILSKGHLVETDRSKLVAGYIGQTAIKTQEVIDSALGGVLFIDEAYALASSSGNDFGKEAIDTLLKAMEDSRDDFVVIAAGYERPMAKFIGTNPGLKSRFKTFINFEDYTGAELIKIFKGLCTKNEYVLSPEAEQCLEEYINYLYDNRNENFGNGRDIRNLFEGIVTAQSRRVSRLANPDDMQMRTILPSDLPMLPPPKHTAAPSAGNNASQTPPQTNTPPVPPKPVYPNPNANENTPETPKAEDTVLKNKGVEENSEFKFDWDKLPSIGFDDVAGLESVKETVKLKVLLPLQNPAAFEGYEKKNGGGLLMYGPPGTGKTMIAAAIANEIGAKFCSVKPSDLLHQGAGQSEKAVRALFAQARKYPCAVICFDEMDSISPKSTKSQYARQLRSEFLSQLQGIDSYNKENQNILFLIATTNKPWDIDSAFLRPGRFGTRVYIGLPDEPARDYMVRNRMEKIRKNGVVAVSSDINYPSIVEKTEGFNGSDMSEMLDKIEENSILRSIKTGVKMISQIDFDSVLSEMTSSVQKDDIENLLEWKKQNG